MHLFIVHQFPDLDNFLPVISNLKKQTNQKFSLLNAYPVHEIKHYNFHEILKKYEIDYINIYEISFRAKLVKFFLNLIKIVPNKIILRSKKFWYFLYHKYLFFDEKNILNLIKTKKIKTINIDHSLPDRYKSIFKNTLKKTEVKLITYKLGIEMRNNINIRSVTYENTDYAVVEDCSTQFKVSNEIKNKLFRITNPRYSLTWLNEIDKEYKYKLKDYTLNKNRKIRVLLLTRPFFSYRTWEKIWNTLKKIDQIDVRFSFKPRGNFIPLNFQGNEIKELNTSELINWADIVIGHATSVLVEAIIKNKKIFFLKYLLEEEKKENINYVFENENFIEIINSHDEIIKKINFFINQEFPKNFDLSIYKNDIKNFLTNLIGNNFDKENLFENNFLGLYKN